MKVYYFESYLLDKHIRRDVMIHAYTTKKVAEQERKRIFRLGRFVTPITVKYE